MAFLSYTDTRNRLKEVLDTADRGVPVGVERHGRRAVVMDMALLYELLAASPRLRRPEAIAEGDGWSVFLPGTPVAADGADLDEATEEFVVALREYAEDWVERLRLAPNHAQHWPLVHFVSLSSDADLTGWVRGGE
ncbi:type II toxin-antitoxin system prevent-host-death family antitoxin [Candidatus Poriferisodalis sp.]|uniref:type II toxin-antitoxin system prevent-host-death family antitoxin n=1 Tax=Candidatus Poriferisodalis sp. TaxID=3101277 RepID=UPI003B014524